MRFSHHITLGAGSPVSVRRVKIGEPVRVAVPNPAASLPTPPAESSVAVWVGGFDGRAVPNVAVVAFAWPHRDFFRSISAEITSENAGAFRQTEYPRLPAFATLSNAVAYTNASGVATFENLTVTGALAGSVHFNFYSSGMVLSMFMGTSVAGIVQPRLPQMATALGSLIEREIAEVRLLSMGGIVANEEMLADWATREGTQPQVVQEGVPFSASVQLVLMSGHDSARRSVQRSVFAMIVRRSVRTISALILLIVEPFPHAFFSTLLLIAHALIYTSRFLLAFLKVDFSNAHFVCVLV